MFKNEKGKNWSRVMAKGRTAFAALLCVLTLSLSGVPVAHGRPIDWGHWTVDELRLLCYNEGGVFGPPGSGGVYYCLLPDGTLYTCSSDGQCVKDTGRSAAGGSSIQDRLDLAEAKDDLINIKLDRLATQLSALQDFLVHGDAPKPDLLPLPNPATPGPAGFCRRDDQGRLHVQILNQGAADAGGSVTRVEFSCGNTQQCNGPTNADAATPALSKLGGITELVFNIPTGCFSPSTNNCNFAIHADVGNTLDEGDEINNNQAGICGAQIQ